MSKHLIKITFLLLIGLSIGCQNVKPFNQPYSFKKDPFIPIYQKHLTSIKDEVFDSNQVSNKTLDPEMIHALYVCNLILSQPTRYAPHLTRRIEELNIGKITIASASRSAYLQARLTSAYKASYLNSFHLLGLAVDLEMKGKSFDIKSHPNDPQINRNYETLSMVLAMCGLVFSEPRELDANHVELYKYCRKKNPNYDRFGLEKKRKLFLTDMLHLSLKKISQPKKDNDGIEWKIIYRDVQEQLNLLN